MSHKNEEEGFVGVHIGAGQHSEARTPLYLDICRAACKAGVEVLREGGTALDAAEKATIVLEDAGETNAGFGSNLTETGTLEMDAGLMDGSTLLFGAVGAITEIKNPIRVARKLVDEQAKGLLPLGRVPPGFLVGEGARDWAIRHGIQSVTSEHLVSEKSAKLYKHYKKKLDTYNLSLEQKRKKEDTCEIACKRIRQAQKLSIAEHVRSNDGATKLVDGNSIDFEESNQSLRAHAESVGARISLPNPVGNDKQHINRTQLQGENCFNLSYQQQKQHHLAATVGTSQQMRLPSMPSLPSLPQHLYHRPHHVSVGVGGAATVPTSITGTVPGQPSNIENKFIRNNIPGPTAAANPPTLPPSNHLHTHPNNQQDIQQVGAPGSTSSATLSNVGVTASGSFDSMTTCQGQKNLPLRTGTTADITTEETCPYDDNVQDTVGVVVLDRHGHVAASVSSGGIALKQSGRVGQASCYGCGCWAQRGLKPASSSVAVSTTGCGEHLVRTLLAKECGQGLATCSNPMESLQSIMKEKFAESEFLEGINEKLGGAICMQFNKSSGQVNFLWTHTTASMGIGFQSTGEDEAMAKMSRLPKPSTNQGTTILVETLQVRNKK